MKIVLSEYYYYVCSPFSLFHEAITMSQKWENVFSHHQSQANVVTDEQLKFQIFANLPLNVFRCFTNIRSLIVGEYQQKCTNFQINRKIQEYYNKLSESDEWNGLLKDLKFNGSHLDEKYAKLTFIYFPCSVFVQAILLIIFTLFLHFR